MIAVGASSLKSYHERSPISLHCWIYIYSSDVHTPMIMLYSSQSFTLYMQMFDWTDDHYSNGDPYQCVD